MLDGRRWASTKIAQPEPRRRRALLSRLATATSSAGTAESRSGPRKCAVRWKDPSLFRTTPGATRAAHGRKSARRVAELRYSARFIIGWPSHTQRTRDAQMPAHDVDEQRVALGRPNGQAMADHPQQQTSQPQ